jgi:hypothetical protein
LESAVNQIMQTLSSILSQFMSYAAA